MTTTNGVTHRMILYVVAAAALGAGSLSPGARLTSTPTQLDLTAQSTPLSGDSLLLPSNESSNCSPGSMSSGPPSASIPPDLQPDFNCKAPTTDSGGDDIGAVAKGAAKKAMSSAAGKGLWNAFKRVAKRAGKDAEGAAKDVGKSTGRCLESGACEASVADDG